MSATMQPATMKGPAIFWRSSSATPRRSTASMPSAAEPRGSATRACRSRPRTRACSISTTNGVSIDPAVTFPTIEDGVAGIAMIDAALRSSRDGGVWVTMTE